jgi:uncharacterized coiled-coil protein SlyX|tara:strand:+ start:5048 stop:5485 length:438 start_codon:yes stop_codon:yes gene_type:complete
MATTKQIAKKNIELLSGFVEKVESGEVHVPMRNGEIYIKGVAELVLCRQLARAPTWMNTNDDAVVLIQRLREFVASDNFNPDVDASTSEVDQLKRDINALEKKLALQEMTIASLKKENEQIKNGKEHTQCTGRLTERLSFCLPSK